MIKVSNETEVSSTPGRGSRGRGGEGASERRRTFDELDSELVERVGAQLVEHAVEVRGVEGARAAARARPAHHVAPPVRRRLPHALVSPSTTLRHMPSSTRHFSPTPTLQIYSMQRIRLPPEGRNEVYKHYNCNVQKCRRYKRSTPPNAGSHTSRITKASPRPRTA